MEMIKLKWIIVPIILIIRGLISVNEGPGRRLMAVISGILLGLLLLAKISD